MSSTEGGLGMPLVWPFEIRKVQYDSEVAVFPFRSTIKLLTEVASGTESAAASVRRELVDFETLADTLD